MNKSNINELSAGTEADSSTNAENKHVSQPNANTNVVGSLFKSREIKFRGNSINPFDDWVYGSLFVIKEWGTDKKGYKILGDGGGSIRVVPESVGEYTGRKSEDGIEIYEGDWCSAEFRTNKETKVIQGRVIMSEFMWCLDCGENVFSINRLCNLIVIGKTYDNPELLQTLR